MSDRGVQRVISICVAAALLMAFVAFAKEVLSPMVATFIAGLGVGAMGVLVLLLAAGRFRRG
jgi:hypothetical protein